MGVSALSIRYIYQRRQQERLQREVSNLLYEYVPMDGFDVESSGLHDKSASLLEARHI